MINSLGDTLAENPVLFVTSRNKDYHRLRKSQGKGFLHKLGHSTPLQGHCMMPRNTPETKRPDMRQKISGETTAWRRAAF